MRCITRLAGGSATYPSLPKNSRDGGEPHSDSARAGHPFDVAVSDRGSLKLVATVRRLDMNDDRIKPSMEVIGADGVHVGTVYRVENGRIRLAKEDSGEGRHRGHHHYIDLGLVADVEGEKVRLSAIGAVAVTFEEEKSGKPI